MLDDELLKKVKEKNIVIPFNSSNIGQGTIKLTLHKNIQLYVTDRPIKSNREFPENDCKTVDISFGEFYLKPGQSAMVRSVETVHTPKNMVAHVYDEINKELFGLKISPMEYIGPRFTGHVRALVVNHGSVPVRLIPGLPICRLSLHQIFDKNRRKRKKRLKTVYILLNSVLTALIGYAVNIENWPFVFGSSIVMAILSIGYMFFRDD